MRINEKNLKIQQLEIELNDLRKLNASNVEINKRTRAIAKAPNENKVSELEETSKELKEQIKRIKAENMEMEKLISRKQSNYQESEKKLVTLKASMFQQEVKMKNANQSGELAKLKSEYENLCQKKKQLLELKNTKETEHKILKENLSEYLKSLQQKFLGFLSTGNL